MMINAGIYLKIVCSLTCHHSQLLYWPPQIGSISQLVVLLDFPSRVTAPLSTYCCVAIVVTPIVCTAVHVAASIVCMAYSPIHWAHYKYIEHDE